MFKVQDDEDREFLSKEMAKQFYRIIFQFLFICKQTRPEVKTLISILTTTWVKQPDEDTWGEMRHGLLYQKGTIYMKRCLIADNLSFMINWDSKEHIGAMASIGKVTIVNTARNTQDACDKLNGV